jgi:hypothetical protein
MEIPSLHQGGVDGVNGGDFPPMAAVDQPFRRWKKGSASASENYGKNMVSPFYQDKGDHKKTEARQPPRAKRALVARPAWWVAPPILV